MVKIIGTRVLLTPEENLHRMERLMREIEMLRPHKKKKGLVIAFKTWDEHDRFIVTRAVKKT